MLNFQFHSIQLNRLNWRDYLRKPNPVAAALMTKMKIAPEDRPKVALQCVRIIATLKLDPARQTLIRSFMDSYLRLSAAETNVYNLEVEAIAEPERKAVMRIINQWEERAARSILIRQLTHKFGELPIPIQEPLETLPLDKLELLADAVLGFSDVADLQSWLVQNS